MSKTIFEKIKEGRQYRDFCLPKIEVREQDDGNMIVEGYATTFDSPYELFDYEGVRLNEQVDARAFDGCDMSDVIMQYNHEGRVFARVSNGTLEVVPDEKGLKVRAHLGGTELGRQLFTEIKGGYTDKMSFGFTVDDDTFTKEEREDGSVDYFRTINKIGKLYDVSAVSIPANNATSISARSLYDGLIEEHKQELLDREERDRRKHRIKVLSEV